MFSRRQLVLTLIMTFVGMTALLAEAKAVSISGKLYNCDATGTLNKTALVKIELYNSANALVQTTYSDTTGQYTINFPTTMLPTDKTVSLKFYKTSTAPVTVVISGIDGSITTNQVVNTTVP